MTAVNAGAHAFVLALTLAGIGFAHTRWRARLSAAWVAADRRSRGVTWTLIGVHLATQIRVLAADRDISALATEGPSTQNLAQAAVLAIAAAWAFHLLARGHVPALSLRAGPGFWVSALVVVYLTSTAWSVWPELTLYRAAELGVFWILLLHLCATTRWEESLRALLWLALASAWAARLSYLDLTSPPEALVGFAYDNTSTLVAAALLLVELHRCLREPSRRGWALVALATFSVLAFGSLATSTGLAVAGVVLLALWGRADARSRDLLLIAALVGAVALGAAFLAPVDGAGDELVAEVAALTGREVTSIESLTGRLPLWVAIGRTTVDEPLGLGFAGAERALALGVLRVEEVGWRAGHAHNGYLSGWLGAGWPGFALVLMVFAAVWQRQRRLPAQRRALGSALLALLTLNNLTAAAVGGPLGVPWMLMMGLAAAPPGGRHRGDPGAADQEAGEADARRVRPL